MLTVNADGYPLMKRFHRPGDEKRSVVVIRPEDYKGWLGSLSTDEARSFLNLFPADEMFAEAAARKGSRRQLGLPRQLQYSAEAVTT
jgi:hypothetical protein